MPILLGLVILIALVYLPKIRRPALWTLVTALTVGVLVAGGWWGKTTYENRRNARLHGRELSYLVDHAIGIPRYCKSKPFPITASKGLTDEQMAVSTRTTRTDQDRAIAAGGVPVVGLSYDKLIAMGAVPAPFDPDAYLCNGEVDALSQFIREHSTELNEFIQDNQSDPRVDAVQGALLIHGLWWKRTCRNLRDEKMDDYELHQQGCK